jgi:hypothetical protein
MNTLLMTRVKIHAICEETKKDGMEQKYISFFTFLFRIKNKIKKTIRPTQGMLNQFVTLFF